MDPQAGGGVAVSVIVPVYNPGKFIEVCIDSLLGQSLASDRLDVIFVDDGSTDGTPDRLDEVAAKESNVRVFHEPASGWSGRPRNVGLDHAIGQYVFFCDHDDWLGPEALERMVSFADDAGADVLIGKMIGHRRVVPRGLFRENDKDATLWSKPLMSSLSPHKLFRRRFLDDHRLRFPEGKRRLEDHVFVVQAYLLASKIAVLSDYPCYHHVRRDDDSNAAFGLVDPAIYLSYVREVIDVIEAHTVPGPQRNHVLERPFTHEMLGRLSRPRRIGPTPDGYYEAMFNEVRSLMIERFPAEFGDRLALANRVRAAAVRDDRIDVLTDLNERLRTVHGRVALKSLRWDCGRWRADIEAEAVFADGSPLRFTPLGDARWAPDPRLLPSAVQSKHDVGTAQLLGGRPSVAAIERGSDEEWLVPSVFTAELRDLPGSSGPAKRVVVTGTAEFDPATLAGGRALPNGVWDIAVRFGNLGVELRARLGADDATQRSLPSAAIVGPRPVTIIPYLTEAHENLTFDVGQRNHTLLGTLLERRVGSVAVTHDSLTARVDVDIAPAASPRSLRLQLLAGDIVAGHCEAAIVADTEGAVLRGGTTPKPSADGINCSAGRYSLGAKSRATDKPSLLGTVDVDRHGRIIAADFDPAQRDAVVPLPRNYGKHSAAQRGNRWIRRLARRVLRRRS